MYCLRVLGLKPWTILSAAEVASWAAGEGKSEKYITGVELYDIIKTSQVNVCVDPDRFCH